MTKNLNGLFSGSQMIGEIRPEDVLQQSPSAMVIMLMVALYMSVLFENRVLVWLGERRGLRRERMSDFRVPDSVVWVLILSLLGSFYRAELGWFKIFAQNCLNVCVVIYFMQGLAVVVRFFEVIRVGFFWRTLWISILAIHLFAVVSFVGLVDYWADFRSRFDKKTTQMKKSLFD